MQLRLSREDIELSINKSNIQEFIKYFDLKGNDKHCYTNMIGSSPSYSYSIETVDLIMSEVKKDKGIFAAIHEKLRNSLNHKKES